MLTFSSLTHLCVVPYMCQHCVFTNNVLFCCFMSKQKRKSNDAVCIPPLDTLAVNKTDYEVFLESVYVCNIPSACAFVLTWSFLKFILMNDLFDLSLTSHTPHLILHNKQSWVNSSRINPSYSPPSLFQMLKHIITLLAKYHC